MTSYNAHAQGELGNLGDTVAPDDSNEQDEPTSPDGVENPKDFWESRYGEKGQIWSGKVNKTLAEIVAPLTPGRSLDLGCGEGGDVVWLASNGWDATGVDISTTAIDRATAAAADAGLERTQFVNADLSEFDGVDSFDLITATFFHSPVELDRETILRQAASLVAPGGHLLLISHAAPPPWAEHIDHEKPTLKPPAEDHASLNLNPDEWQTVLLETREREAIGPNGEPATLDDGVILLKRQ